VISEKHETIFIHIPKCAGLSVRNVLRQSGFTLIRLDKKTEDIRSGFYKQGTAARMRRYADRDLWDRSFKFCVCRNPYDRLVSGWSFCRQKNQLNVPFDYFVWHMKTFDSFWINWHCSIPQKQHILIDGVPIVDRVCRFETLDRDFDLIRARIGNPAGPLPHQNSSSHKPYREYYTKELQDIVFERFGDDFEFFGYQYDL
jgi:Sulfotransferase family